MSLEQALLSATPDDMPDAATLAASLPDAPPVGLPPVDALGDLGEGPAPADYMDQSQFGEVWGQVHDLMGGMVQMRTGNPCPLGDQARSAGGIAAATAAYSLLAANEFTRSLFLSPNSSFVGSAMVIGLHGFACVQIVKSSQLPPPEFQSARA